MQETKEQKSANYDQMITWLEEEKQRVINRRKAHEAAEESELADHFRKETKALQETIDLLKKKKKTSPGGFGIFAKDGSISVHIQFSDKSNFINEMVNFAIKNREFGEIFTAIGMKLFFTKVFQKMKK